MTPRVLALWGQNPAGAIRYHMIMTNTCLTKLFDAGML